MSQKLNQTLQSDLKDVDRIKMATALYKICMVFTRTEYCGPKDKFLSFWNELKENLKFMIAEECTQEKRMQVALVSDEVEDVVIHSWHG